MIEAYQRNGGLALIGNEAWGHLLQEAGPVMSRFLSTYLIAPIEQLNGARSDVMDMTVRVRPEHIDYLFTRPGGEVERIRVQRNLS